MEKFSVFIYKYRYALSAVLLAALIFLGIILYNIYTHTYVTARFTQLRPFREKLEIFYKGFPIGHAQHCKPNKEYTATLVKLELYPGDLKLPNNIIVKLKREKKDDKKVDFLELVYPEEPNKELLKDGDVIEGIGTIDIESYLASQEPESLDQIKEDFGNAIGSFSAAFSAIADVFDSVNDIVNENRNNIKQSTDNLVKTTTNIRQMSEKMNNSLKQEQLDNSFTNVSSSTEDFRETSRRLGVISQNIDVLTQSLNAAMPTVSTTLAEAQCIVKNLNEITCGISRTLQKNMGGMRIFFGKVIDDDCTCKRPCGK